MLESLSKFIGILAVVTFTSLNVSAASVDFKKNLEWVSDRNLSGQEYSQKYRTYQRSGYILTDLDAYRKGTALKFSMVWKKNTDRRGWGAYRNMTTQQYSTRWKEFSEKGYRPTDIESYIADGGRKYAGIWVQNKEKYPWSSKRNMTEASYRTYYTQKRREGFRLVDFEAYLTKDGVRFAAIWLKDRNNVQWTHTPGVSRNEYQAQVNKLTRQDYILTDFEAYRSGARMLYAATWEKRSGFASVIRSNLNETQFANLFREYQDKGFRLVDFEKYGLNKYAGVWIENNSRYRFKDKAKIDKILKDYRSTNNIPGISAGVIQNGEMIYRRGFGFANVAAKKQAHGETVYNAASVSKVIGGTLAVKLAEKGRINFNEKTNVALRGLKIANGRTMNIPYKHNYPVKYLFSHLACVKHYSGPEPKTRNYKKAIDALIQIWNEPFISGCKSGVNRNYSTHAFTYTAALLEHKTNKPFAQLLRGEITRPHGLSSMRMAFEKPRLVPDYDRTAFYDNSNRSVTLTDNSWKVIGGGIESSTVDLARFGWKVLDGQIVSPKARDNILWKRVNSNTTNGIGWEVNGDNTVEHGGVFDGSRTFLKIYRDKNLVIAIMSNKRGPNGLGGLSDNIADLF